MIIIVIKYFKVSSAAVVICTFRVNVFSGPIDGSGVQISRVYTNKKSLANLTFD